MKKFAPVLAAALALFATDAAVAQTAPPQTAASQPAPAEYLARNAKLPGVTALPSGLQYKVLSSGPAGPSPKPGDVIKVHYEGKLATGEVFDSSFERGRPALMPLDGLINGWMEAIPRMHVGDEWVLYIPPQLGYGPEGSGPIPANAVLVFRIKLLGMLSAD